MATNATLGFQKSQEEFSRAVTNEEKLKALKKMLSEAPSHKASEKLRADIKKRIGLYKGLCEKERIQKKKGGGKYGFSLKKEGAATVCFVGTTNTGKSYILHKLTNADVKISESPFTTKKPVVGMMDYSGIKVQVVEMPSIVEDYAENENGPSFISIIKQVELLVIFFNTPEEKQLIDKELIKNEVNTRQTVFNNEESIRDLIWRNIGLIKVFTKQPGKKVEDKAIALKINSPLKELAEVVHKDFLKKFKYAKVWGKSAKFKGQMVGLSHKLEDNDIVEFHLK